MPLHFFAIPALTPQPAQDEFNRIPDYIAASTISKNVISAWVAEIQEPRMASVEHIRAAWIPAIHAGMTLLLKQLVYSILPNWYFAPLFDKEGLGEIFKINPPRSPFFKEGRRLNLPGLSYGMRKMTFNYD